MSRRCASLTLDNLDDLPHPCRRCVFWELDPGAREAAEQDGTVAAEKEAWLSATLLDWGSCGKVVYVDSIAAGYVSFAPPGHVPRAMAFPTSPVSADAVLLMTARLLPEFTGTGLGRLLVQTVAKDLTRRGIRALEAFGRMPPADGGELRPGGCVVPTEFLLAVGFKTVRPHPLFPRLRLDLRSTLSWREDMEVALERLLGSINPEAALRPV